MIPHLSPDFLFSILSNQRWKTSPNHGVSTMGFRCGHPMVVCKLVQVALWVLTLVSGWLGWLGGWPGVMKGGVVAAKYEVNKCSQSFCVEAFWKLFQVGCWGCWIFCLTKLQYNQKHQDCLFDLCNGQIMYCKSGLPTPWGTPQQTRSWWICHCAYFWMMVNLAGVLGNLTQPGPGGLWSQSA